MAKPKEKELSALELMIEHADTVGSSVAGMPKRKRKPKASNDEPSFDFDFEYDPEMEDENVVYVGPGSRAKNKAAREQRARLANERVRYVNTEPSAVSATAPSKRETEAALEEIFIAGEKSGDDIVQAIRDGNKVSAKTQKALEDWLAWEKSEAFKEKNKAKSDPHGMQPGAGSLVSDIAPKDEPANDPSAGNDLGGADERRNRKRGKRYGRNRGPRERGRNLPNRRIPLSQRLGRFGKYGKMAGLAVAAGATLGLGVMLKDSAGEQAEEANAHNAGVGAPEAPKQVEQQQVQRADDAAKQVVEAETPKAPSAAQDMAVSGASMLLMGASKRIPIVGPALGNGLMLANDVQHINADEGMTDAEKTKAKETATGSAVGGAAGGSIGAVAGGWIGGVLGSVVPVAGTAAGAALGATIGGILGDYFGSSVGEYVSAKITDESDKLLADGEKDRQEKIEEYNDTTLENMQADTPKAPTIMPFNFGGMFGVSGSGSGQYQGPMRAQPARRMDSKQVTDIANRAIAEGGLGAVSEQFESGGRGVGTVSSGRGDYGGVSYGKHQLSTNTGSMMNFLNSPEGKPFLERFGGLAPGTSQFNSVYKDVANTQGAEFEKAQSDFITRTHYAPMVAKVQNDVGVDLSQRGAGVKELMYSTAVQYGANSSVIANALRGKDVNAMSDDDLIKVIQDYKAATTDRYFKSSDVQTQKSVATRAQNEKDVLLKVAEAERGKKSVNKQGETEEQQDARIAARFPNLPKGTGVKEYEDSPSNLPDLTGKGPTRPKSTPEEHERRLNELVSSAYPEVKRIEPVVQAPPTVERQPLVTEGDIARTESPTPPVIQPTAPPVQKASASPRAAAPVQSAPNPGNAHSLDSIPVFLDDPMMNMMTMGYM